MPSSGMLCREAPVRTDVSKELIASIVRATKIDEVGRTLAVTGNRRTLQGIIYGGFCSLRSDFLMVHCVIRSTHPSLYSEGGLFGLCQTVRWRTPSYVPVYRSSQPAISTEPSTFHKWVCGRRSLSIQVLSGFHFL
jgi:hypothetical protein